MGYPNRLLVLVALLLPVLSPAAVSAQTSSSPAPAPPTTGAVLRFGVQGSQNDGVSALSVKSCPVGGADEAASTSGDPIQVDPAILDQLSEKMNERLSKKMTVLVDPAESTIPSGAMIISGCVTRANPGNATTRLIGANVGASHLNVHVIALRKGEDGALHPFDDFDLEVKGGDILPPLGPIGLAVHAARDRRQTLAADADKLAGKILKKIASDEKEKQQKVS